MAEKRFIKGLFKDTAPIDQPDGSWRYARNMILNETDGAVSNEGGTDLAGYIGDKKVNPLYVSVGDWAAKVIGKIEVDNDKIVLFSVDEEEQNNVDSVDTYACEIGIWQNEKYSVLYKPAVTVGGVGNRNTNLKFNTSNPIEGTYKIDAKEDLIIYWTDDLNSPRAFNVSRQQRWLTEASIANPYEWLYGIDPAGSHDDHISLLNLFPHSGPVPHIQMHDIYWATPPYQKSVNTGGGLLTGVYYLALAYVDNDFVSTNYLTVSNPVSITEDYDHTRPRNKKDGAKHGTQTTKAIKWRVENLNTDYKYLSPVIVRKMGDATEAFKLNVIEINPDTFGRLNVVFSGLEGFTPSSVKDVIIDTISYETAKTINQLDGVLYLGNLKGKEDLGYQKYANGIKLYSKIKTFDHFDVFYATIDNLTTGFGNREVDVFAGAFRDVDASQSYRYVPNIYRWKGYQRDEVYAFYIAFVMKDGSMSYAYHIPGRESITTPLIVDEDSTNDSHANGYPGFDILEDSFLTSIGGTTTIVTPGSDDLGNPPTVSSGNPNTQYTSVIYKDLQRLSPSYAKNFHFFDFSQLTGARNMNYWQNATETYPSTDDYEVWDETTFIDAAGVTQNLVGNIQGTNVRHHHFPSNEHPGRGVFKLLDKPGGGGSPQSGWNCETALSEGPLTPKPWRVCFKAYMEVSDDSQSVPPSLPYNTTNGPCLALPGMPHADHVNYAAELTSYVNSTSASGTHEDNAANPGAVWTTTGKAAVLHFNDAYPFGDSTTIDDHNPKLPGITDPSIHLGNDSSVVSTVQKNAYDALWRGNHFKADQDMTVRMTLRAEASWDEDGSYPTARFYYKIKRANYTSGSGYDEGLFATVNPLFYTQTPPHCGCLRAQPEPYHDIHDYIMSIKAARTVNLKKNDEVFIMVMNHKGSQPSIGALSWNKFVVPYSSKCDLQRSPVQTSWDADERLFQSEIMFEVETPREEADEEMYTDTKLDHEVRALGFSLGDVKIPKSIADKVQGFRIYHAKRGHSDKTILGQAPAIPMRPDKAIIGICKEALTATNMSDGQWIMQTETETPQAILRKEPFAFWSTFYPKYTGIYGGSNEGEKELHGHKYFSYYDFHLLRTKNSLAGATHIKHQWFVQNFAYQGPTVQQPKKMVSKIVPNTATTPPIKSITEEWGWNTSYNCYGEAVGTAAFLGCHYNPYQTKNVDGFSDAFRPFSLPKVLNQKSISYLRGDSIFRAEALGFGGTIVNEGGDSSIVYGFKDRHEEYAYQNSLSSSCNDWSFYGGYSNANPFYLAGNPINPIYHGGVKCDRQNFIKIDNLHAFKTDVYKSIDTQELVWTGFEVLGQDLNNFIFWDQEAIDALPANLGTLTPNQGEPFNFKYINKSGNANDEDSNGNPINGNYTADYNIATLQKEIQRDVVGKCIDPSQHHIFGGDTFISRYGFLSGYTPRDSATSSRPKRAIHFYITESPDNINFRHIESDKSLYFPGTSAKEMLDKFTDSGGKPNDYNHQDNLKYDSNFSAVNDIRPAFPLPIRENKQTIFSTRAHRSVKSDATSVIDNYRIFKANQFKDLPKHRGDLWKLSTFNNLLYFHMEESLYAAKGKQQMEMKDGSEAFVGSGDIFQQDPDELIQTDGGYGGTQSQYAALTTRFGYFFVDAISNKVFMMKDKLLEISAIGMETWFKDNIPYQLTAYGYANCTVDNPIEGIGFHSVYDNKHKRIILTKREFTPTQKFIDGTEAVSVTGNGNCQNYAMGQIRFFSNECTFKEWGPRKLASPQCSVCCEWRTIPMSCQGEGASYFNCSGWSISYYPELGVWASFHDYIPYIYFNTSTDFYSLTDQYPRPVWCTNQMVFAGVAGCTTATTVANWRGSTYGNAGIWKHNGSRRGILYQDNQLNLFSADDFTEQANQYPFEYEIIHNETKSIDSILSSFNYTLETFNENNISVLQHGFTRFYLYNTFQISADTTAVNPITGLLGLAGTNLEYLINIRRIGNNWKVNSFRDTAAIALDNTAGGYYMSTNTNIIGGLNTGTITSSSTQEMFIIDGMFENINNNYIDTAKLWHQRKKFIDKWVGIRLIYDNISNNLLNLYSTNVATRKIHR